METIKTEKPKIGEIRRADEIGYSNKSYRTRFIWAACDICGKERWVKVQKGKPQTSYCLPCANRYVRDLHRGKRNWHWKGGSGISTEGYRWRLLQSDDFFFPMASQTNKHKGHIYEHRLIMAKHLKRCLLPWEHVHHRNGNRLDNRIENLELVRPKDHRVITHMETEIKRLQKRTDVQDKRILMLEAENVRISVELDQLKSKI